MILSSGSQVSPIFRELHGPDRIPGAACGLGRPMVDRSASRLRNLDPCSTPQLLRQKDAVEVLLFLPM